MDMLNRWTDCEGRIVGLIVRVGGRWQTVLEAAKQVGPSCYYPHPGGDDAFVALNAELVPTPYTLHTAPYTLHPTPYTLHPTPYPVHPTPYNLRLSLSLSLSLHLHLFLPLAHPSAEFASRAE